MAKRITSFLYFLIISSVLVSLTACHGTTKAPDKFGFKDEKGIRDALLGSWILQEYQDSIDAGLTPKLLEFMLDREHSIEYHPGDGNEATIGYKGNNSEERLTLKFDYKTNKVFFLSKPDAGKADKDSSAQSGQLGYAEFMFNGADTTLLFYNDSTPQKPLEFTKYDMSKCAKVPAYLHLVSSKFIAGQYYLAADKEKLHHIIFTKCQNIEGAENISPAINNGSFYEVQLDQFRSDGDKIKFLDAKGNGSSEMFWTVSKDSLILTPYATNRKSKEIVLLRTK